jgi:hypothetical protein
MPVPVQLVGGLGGAIGCDFRRTQNQLVFVEYSGKLSRLNLYRTGTVVSSGTAVLKGTWTFDLDTGAEGGLGPNFDIWWEQETAVVRSMTPLNSAQLVNLGMADFNSLTPDTLSSLTYSTMPIDGNNDGSNKLVTGDVFAVLTTSGNYAKVKVVAYGYDMTIQWTTYKLDPLYAVLGTGYTNPEDVKASADGAHVYVTERSGDLLKVALASANRAFAKVVCSGMNAPQQLYLDEVAGYAYVVEYVATGGHLWQINLGTGVKTALLSNLQNAVGVVITADRQYAYISEQTTGPDKGRVSRFQLSSGTRVAVATGLTAPFFLTWLDSSQTSFLVPQRDPANSILLISLTAGTAQVIASGVANRPSSVAVVSTAELLICTDQTIEEYDFALASSGPLLMGIGFIPFDKVVTLPGPNLGLADTTVDPTYFYQVKDTPFGGTLPLMINHQRADNDGDVYYRVKVDGVVRTDAWTDEFWNGAEYVAVTTTPISIGGIPGYYPVHPISQLFLWLNPSLGDLLDSTNLSNGFHTITVEFSNAAGTVLETSGALTIRVDNNSCGATIATPVLETMPPATADPTCGLLHYGTKSSTLVSMAFTATHPNGFATFSWELIKGVNQVTLPPSPPPPPTSGPVSAVVSPITDSVTNLLGTCTIAAYAEYVYVYATANNGWSRQSQYDASALIAFVLAP